MSNTRNKKLTQTQILTASRCWRYDVGVSSLITWAAITWSIPLSYIYIGYRKCLHVYQIPGTSHPRKIRTEIMLLSIFHFLIQKMRCLANRGVRELKFSGPWVLHWTFYKGWTQFTIYRNFRFCGGWIIVGSNPEYSSSCAVFMYLCTTWPPGNC